MTELRNDARGSRAFSTAVVLLVVLGGSALTAYAANQGTTGSGIMGWFDRWRTSNQVLPVADARYANECGSCHVAYPAGLLPARSWRAVLAKLDDHFGDNAELDPQAMSAVRSYLLAHAADRIETGLAKRIIDSIPSAKTPERFTSTAFFRERHREISASMVAKNPKIGSFSRCDACHREIAQGNFDEDSVKIPGGGNDG